MHKLRIAIIDSGVKLDHPALKNNNPQIIHFSGVGECEGKCGHGTAIYNIIKKVEDFVDIIIFQITNNNGEIDEDMLLSCLKKINNEYNVDIINISLGLSLCDNISELYCICDELSSKGVIIISAFDNLGSISYPAAFDNVIGVTSVESCRKISDFIVLDNSVVNICANGNLQRLAWDSPDYIIFSGNSFACAHVTVQVARFMLDGAFSFCEIINRFKLISKQIIYDPQRDQSSKLWFNINRAVIFPFNKEMHSLIRFYNQLKFEISDVFDIKESFNVGSTTDHIMNSNVKSFQVKSISEIEWEKFDTIIIGNIPSEDTTPLLKAREKIVEMAIALRKNIFSFDDLKVDYDFFYYPRVTHNELPPERLGKLYRITKPVIGVYGTSSNQGKFTLQLALREKLLKLEYNVGQIGTEPSSQLFGIDYTYPMGFNSTVNIGDHDAILYLNECINLLCMKNSDIIITGSQGSVLPTDIGNKIMFPLKQFNFLMGTQPDCMILCINPYDDIEYIRRTISFLESSVDGKVISICVYPMKYKSDWSSIYSQKESLSNNEFYTLKEILVEKFSIPIYKLGNEDDLNALLNDIINFFS